MKLLDDKNNKVIANLESEQTESILQAKVLENLENSETSDKQILDESEEQGKEIYPIKENDERDREISEKSEMEQRSDTGEHTLEHNSEDIGEVEVSETVETSKETDPLHDIGTEAQEYDAEERSSQEITENLNRTPTCLDEHTNFSDDNAEEENVSDVQNIQKASHTTEKFSSVDNQTQDNAVDNILVVNAAVMRPEDQTKQSQVEADDVIHNIEPQTVNISQEDILHVEADNWKLQNLENSQDKSDEIGFLQEIEAGEESVTNKGVSENLEMEQTNSKDRPAVKHISEEVTGTMKHNSQNIQEQNEEINPLKESYPEHDDG